MARCFFVTMVLLVLTQAALSQEPEVEQVVQDTVLLSIHRVQAYRVPWTTTRRTEVLWKLWYYDAEQDVWLDRADSHLANIPLRFKIEIRDTTGREALILSDTIGDQHRYETDRLPVGTYKVRVELENTPTDLVSVASQEYNERVFQISRKPLDNLLVSMLSAVTLPMLRLLGDFFEKAGNIGYFLAGFLFFMLVVILSHISRLFWRKRFFIFRRSLLRLFPKNEPYDRVKDLAWDARRWVLGFDNYSKRNNFTRRFESLWNAYLTKEREVTSSRLNGGVDAAKRRELQAELAALEQECRRHESMLTGVLVEGIRTRSQNINEYLTCTTPVRYVENALDKKIEVVHNELLGIIPKSNNGIPQNNEAKPNNQKKLWLSVFSTETFWVLGTVAPLLGLLGTVVGLANAFRRLSGSELKIQSVVSDLAADIHLALYTTIGGLIVGSIAILFYYYFKTQIMSFLGELDKILDRTLKRRA